MVNKLIVSTFLAMLFFASCVSKKEYNDLNSKKTKLESDLAKTKKTLHKKEKELLELEKANQQLLGDVEDWKKKFKRLQADTTDLNEAYRKLKNEYANVSRMSSAKAQQLLEEGEKIKSLQKELDAKTKKMNEQQLALDKQEKNQKELAEQLADREARVRELQRRIAEKDSVLNALQNKLTQALLGFKDSGLTVEMKDGKVYVSLDNKLLFASGKHTVDVKGKQALKELALVLKEQADILIMVEGHTDDVPLKGQQQIKDNWDLSVMRATSVVKELTVNGVDSKHVIAAGRGEYIPKMEGKTTEARAKNRRIEIIISPKLDELYDLVNQKQ